MWSKVEEMIEKSVQNELRYGKDKYDKKQWDFVDKKAAKLCLNKIKEDYEPNEINTITQTDVDGYFQDVIKQNM